MEDPELPQQLDLSTLVDGPFVATFTAHLPFPICIPNELGHAIVYGIPFIDEAAKAEFGPWPHVRIRVFEVAESGLLMWRPRACCSTRTG